MSSKDETVRRYLKGAKHHKTLDERKELERWSNERRSRQRRRGGRERRDWIAEADETVERERIPRAPQLRRGAAGATGVGAGVASVDDGLATALVLTLAPGRAHLVLEGRECPAVLDGAIAREQKTRIAVGDRVGVEELADGSLCVRAVRPRTSVLARPDPAVPGRERVLVANVERAAIVVAVRAPAFRSRLIDRYLVALGRGGVEPIVCANKADLLEDGRAEIEGALADFRALGVPCLFTSAATREGLDELRALLDGRTSVFVGQSGVGKSSLLNALHPVLALRTGEVRGGDGKGRHTTTGSTLLDLGGGTRVIDTPGVRALGLTGVDRSTLGTWFPEFAEVGACRFDDCLHAVEPDCSVQAAVERGELSRRRYDTYRRILDTL